MTSHNPTASAPLSKREKTILRALVNAEQPLSISDIETIAQSTATYYGLGKVVMSRLSKKLIAQCDVTITAAWTSAPGHCWGKNATKETRHRRRRYWLGDAQKARVRELLPQVMAQQSPAVQEAHDVLQTR